MSRIYFDNASTTPIDPDVLDFMTDIMKEHYGNPSSIHAYGRKAKSLIEDARKTIADILNSSIGEIFFTSSATEANNMALIASVKDLGIRHIISSPTEHPNVLKALETLQDTYDIRITLLAVDNKGNIDLAELENILSSSAAKKLVSLMYANNEIGTLHPVDQIARLCRENHALFHCDTVQAIGKFPIDLQAWPVHFISGSAHKFYGPKGTGFLYINSVNQIKPLFVGGAQERNMRASTENVHGIAGMAMALKIASQNMDSRNRYILDLRQYLITSLKDISDDISFCGNMEESFHPAILNALIPSSPKTDLLMMNLDIAGICASAGSACSSGVEQQSHVLQAIGVPDNMNAVRFSMSHHNTKEEIDFICNVVAKLLKS